MCVYVCVLVEVCFDYFVPFFVMGFVLQFGKIAHKRVRFVIIILLINYCYLMHCNFI